MIIDCISDLHGHYPELEGGDLLIVAGDVTATDHAWEYVEFGMWLNKQNYAKKVVIAGNHDNIAQKASPFIDPENDYDYEWDYLCDSGIEFGGMKIWGSPWTTRFPGMNPHCMAFTVDSDEELAEKWTMIPGDIDILVTHSPPFGIFDKVERGVSLPEYSIAPNTLNVGSPSLVHWIANHISKLRLHVFGHVHEGHGIYDIRDTQKKMGDSPSPVFINASHVNERYHPVNKPIRVIL